MSSYLENLKFCAPAGVKKESRIALLKKVDKLNLVIVLVLRGVKGLEKAYVVSREEELSRILEQFSATALDVDKLNPENLLGLPSGLREVVVRYGELLKRLSSELISLVG
ncbi:MAG: hypothetical protein RMH84_02050 [Sulfolobales archaeon]|nr:hypothetical protein [Sulfolobales archaeon]MCX8208596.1 hypothetical protein [Sulfolobales archaeon]MDW8010360.1 hypothetical protein [Sulfolobales archaeon]